MINHSLRFSILLVVMTSCFLLIGQEDETLIDTFEQHPIVQPVKRGEQAFFIATGKADFYRMSSDRYKPIGSSSVSAWMAGLSLRSGKKWYEVRVDLYYAQQGGSELFQSPIDGTVASEVSLKYLGLRAQPLNIRLQKEKFYFHVGAGGYASVLLSNKVEVNDRLFENNGSNYELTQYDYGLVFSSGIGYGIINIVGTFQVGLQPVEEFNNSIKNHLLTIGLNIWL